ncbi:MAG: polysaccharide biosynthesis tyrosine autokinase [Anaerolineae bacterium]
MELKDYIRPLRKWWWLIVAATLVATFSSFLATRQQPPIYHTRVTVMVGSAIENPNPSGNEFWLTQQLANTYADIVKRDPVRNATMAALGLSWLPEYTARVVPNTQLVEISVTDTSPQRAQAVADELARQLVLLSPTGPGRDDQQRQAFINQQLSDLEAKIQETQDEINRKQTELANMFSARQIADTQAQIAGLQNKLTTLQANYAALLANTQRGALNSITVIEPAALPVTPVGPNKPAIILLAAAIGFLLAAGAAYLLEYLDDTLKNPDDIQKSIGLTALGAVPNLGEIAAGNELVVMTGGQSAGAEAYRILRTNLQFAGVDRPVRTLMIASPAPREGKTLTAGNLGIAFAQAGQRVILVDADLHRPQLHRIFGLRNNVGLTSALLEPQPTTDGLLQETAVPGLQVLTSGPLPPNPAELLASRRMREFTQKLLEMADIVIFDTPPVIALADAAIVGSQVDGVLLVVCAGETRREVAQRALGALQQVNARVVGALINRLPAQRAGYYYYYYYHYGYYGDGEDGRRGRGNGRQRRGNSRSRQPAAPAQRPLPSETGVPSQ